jgi:nucleoid-associated protein YgaU
MGFFSNILEKLGLKKGEEEAKPAAAPAAPAAPAVAAPAKPVATAKPVVAAPVKPAAVEKAKDDVAQFDPLSSLPTAKPVVVTPIAVSEVDVVKHLEELSLGKNLDWKVSIVDLLKLLDIDSSRESRNELATELGCPADLMGDSAKMNVWLHKEVLKQIAKNGGNIPASMLD